MRVSKFCDILTAQTMTTRKRHYCTRLLCAGLLAGAAACAHASSASVTINATVIEVQCTAEQRTRIRACAPAQEKYTTESSKTLVGVQSAGSGSQMLDSPYEIRLDPTRPVLIKTVLY
jgi:hypothetical protein